MEKKTVGFIGLGAMGSNSARRLVERGFRVQGFDLRAEARDELERAGGSGCASAAEAARGADAVVLFVVNGKQADQALFGPAGVAEGLAAGADVLSCVTMSPSEAAVLGKRCAERGWGFVDSPVSGGVKGAAAGALTIMAGGADAVVERCRPIYEAMGTRLMRVGMEPGQGSMVKTINQLLCGVHLAAAGEALGDRQREADVEAGLAVLLVGAHVADGIHRAHDPQHRSHQDKQHPQGLHLEGDGHPGERLEPPQARALAGQHRRHQRQHDRQQGRRRQQRHGLAQVGGTAAQRDQQRAECGQAQGRDDGQFGVHRVACGRSDCTASAA